MALTNDLGDPSWQLKLFSSPPEGRTYEDELIRQGRLLKLRAEPGGVELLAQTPGSEMA